MDYDEPDSKHGMRRWHTSVGLTSKEAGCLVSVRVTNYMVPGFIGVEPPQPTSTTPTFVSGLIGLDGCQVLSGETVLLGGVTRLTWSNFNEQFVECLLSDRRE